jgi:hypothetical protein
MKMVVYLVFLLFVGAIIFNLNCISQINSAISENIFGSTLQNDDDTIDISSTDSNHSLQSHQPIQHDEQQHQMNEGSATSSTTTLPIDIIDNDIEISSSPKHSDSKKSSQKLIQPGQHSNIYPPEMIPGPNGEPGYVHDPKFLIKNPPPYQIPKDELEEICKPPGQGNETIEGAKHLERIRHHMETSQASRNVTLFCAIYTISAYERKSRAVSETWGKRCHGLLYASDVTNTTTGHIRLAPKQKIKFTYRSMFQRVCTMMVYIYDNFLDDYDYFHFGGEDVFMMVENMKEFLASDKVKRWEQDNEDKYLMAGFWTKFWNHISTDFYLAGG